MTTSQDRFSELDVFYGDLGVSRAVVYARLPRVDASLDWSLTGYVRGPRCALAETLPATSPLVDLGPGKTMLGRALVVDPAFWSAELPAIYDVTVEVRQRGEVIAKATREIGFKPIGVRGRWIVREEKPWVLRGVLGSSALELDMDEFRAAGAVLVDDGKANVDYCAASRSGVWIFGNPSSRLLAQHPAVAFAAIGSGVQNADGAHNMVLVQRLEIGGGEQIAPQAQALLIPASDPTRFANFAATMQLPVIAARPLAARRSVAEVRAACDELQRDLAPFGQYAGYIV